MTCVYKIHCRNSNESTNELSTLGGFFPSYIVDSRVRSSPEPCMATYKGVT